MRVASPMKRDIKICGLKTAEALDAALVNGATHIGFNFFPKSPRYVAPEHAGALRIAALRKAKAVAVVVDAEDTQLDQIVAAMKPDMLQLHGKETPERTAAIKARYGLPVIKALSISTAEDLAKVDAYRGIADRFLFDAKPPAGSQLPGGNGVSFDWTMLTGLGSTVDYFLAGGLNPNNVAEAVRQADPPGLDVSSGVESAPGEKDAGLIGAFFAAARGAD